MFYCSDALESTFDFVLSLDEGQCGHLQEMKMAADSLAKAFAMSFTFFDECIFLPPNSLVLKNCDELFGLDNQQETLEMKRNEMTAASGKVVQFQPSREAFKKVVGFIQANHKNG